MMRVHGSCVGALTLAMIAASSAAGQVDDEAQLRELVEVLVRGDVLLGRIPDGSPLATVIPSDARIVGTVQRTWGGSTVVASLRGDDAQVTERMRQALLTAGWTAPEQELPDRMGFVSGRAFQSAVFCGDDSHVMLNTSEGRPGEVRIQLSLSESGRATPCDQPGMMHPVNWPLPTLQAPEGLNVRGGGSMSSSGDGVMTSASYETEMSVEELAAHFAAQVESQDWEPTGVHEDSVVAMRTYTRTSDDGRPLHGMLLIVAPHGARSKEAMFRVVTLARTRRE